MTSMDLFSSGSDAPIDSYPAEEARHPAKTRQATPQQQEAVRRRGTSIVLSSGAGCGKTTVLTDRYLSYLRDGSEVGQIVAITFTERAAREMRGRIRAALTKELITAPRDQAERWQRQLRGLETAPIQTIHAFCGSLLRQHALEVGLDPHFEILDDALAGHFRQEVMQTSLQQLLTATGATGESLRALVVQYGWATAGRAIEQLAGQHDAAAWKAWQKRPAAAIAGDWRGPFRSALLGRTVQFLIEAQPKIAGCLALLRTIPCLSPTMQERVDRLLQDTPRLATAPDLATAVEQLCEAAKVAGTERGDAWPSEAAYQQIKEAFTAFREELPKRLQVFLSEPADLEEAVAVGQRFLRVADEVAQAYAREKRRLARVDFDDLLHMARDLMQSHAAVRDQLRQRYRHVLIDELQDTDRVQIELVQELCGVELTEGKLFAVGDSKQSIYRFRGAEVRLFQDLRDRVPIDGRLELSVNFRSQPDILHFTNALFAKRMVPYEPLEPERKKLHEGSAVEFLWTRREKPDLAVEARQREAETIARRLASMVALGERLVVDDRDSPTPVLRSVRPGDIVLLFRSMSFVHLYEAALRTQGLDYYLVGGRAFFAQQEIYDLLHLLRSLENPQDAVSLAGTLRSPFCGLSDEALYWLARHADGLWAGLHDDALIAKVPAEQRPGVERARQRLNRWREHKDRLPIARLLNLVLADAGYDAAVQYEFLGDRKLANLWKLIDLARSFDRSGAFVLADFIRRLSDLVESQPREEQAATQPENADVIRLMTIHQAKGLEFPIVVVPDLAANGRTARFAVAHWDARLGCVVKPPAEDEPPLFTDFGWRLWQAAENVEDYHEDLRTLYVACTRAQDYLVLSAALPEDGPRANTWMLTLAEAFDLETGACRHRDWPEGQRPSARVVRDSSLSTIPALPRPGPNETPEYGPDLVAGIAPVPVQLGARPLLSLEGLEAVAGSPSELVWQFDAEDGSDRSEWLTRRERAARGWPDSSR